ncbi:MAG: bifunctional aspartate kinase/homoserine dehydrogenase I [Saprospiraceae bacterium]|nr:bifunctional aspartate kinase/homoserine dehydrogenase I [Saprospiraceae bacterium]MDW8483571.1 bifunctional aspartate kinase/homoserine dehydrogenase I [Saprospiraceae bacterium]
MRVLKFGGTSVGSPQTIQDLLLPVLVDYHRKGQAFTVVFSAFSKVTDALIETAYCAARGDGYYLSLWEKLRQRHVEAAASLLKAENRVPLETALMEHFEELGNLLHGIYLLREVSARSLDLVLSFGERTSTLILTYAMQQAGIPSEYVDARRIIRTDARFGQAQVLFEPTNALIRAHYDQRKGMVQAVTGFIGSTEDGLTTTLGRGGSDYTAAILGAALEAEAIELWTDVDGVLTADPRRVKKAFTLRTMTYREAMEMSHFGAKVIYPPTIRPAMEKGIPLLIRNTFNPTFEGTYIGPSLPTEEEPRQAVKGISSIHQISLLTLEGGGLFGVPGIAARLFGAMAREGINIVLITQGSSESSITFAVSPQQAALARQAAEREFAYELRTGLVEPLRVEENLSVVAIVGEGMRYTPGIAGRLFQALGRNGINVVAIAQGSSELNISVVISSADENKALNAIHEAFFLSDTKSLNLFVVGVGLIGSALLEQIRRQASFLRERRRLEIKVVGLANSRQMVFDKEGLDLNRWRTILEQNGQPFSIDAFVDQMEYLNLPNAIFIDNTAAEAVTRAYERILAASISISTPNKLAASGSWAQYQRLKAIADRRGALWRYETNVGAGLPIISTLNDLLASGDRILRIEGVLSGTLSFLFNHFIEGRRFSDVVQEARRRGLTEPDPRDDLSGADVRRKALILAREVGFPLELEDIPVENILPAPCLEAPSVEAFMESLRLYDDYFEAIRVEAAAQGKVLRWVALIEKGQACIGLQRVGPEHPFYNLSGSDNMVVFTTERYAERPLVVRGPGAGAEVTAAGIFAEVIGMSAALSARG